MSGHSSAVGPAEDRESSPAKEHRSATVPHNEYSVFTVLRWRRSGMSHTVGFVYSADADADGRLGLCVFGGLCVDMWRLVHQWSFLLFWLSFDYFWRWYTVGTRLVQSWYRPVTIGTPVVIFAVLTVFWLFLTVGVPMVTGLPKLYQQCTGSVPIVKNSQKQLWHLSLVVYCGYSTTKRQIRLRMHSMGLLETLDYACLTLYRIMLSVYVSAHIEFPHLQVSAS